MRGYPGSGYAHDPVLPVPPGEFHRVEVVTSFTLAIAGHAWLLRLAIRVFQVNTSVFRAVKFGGRGRKPYHAHRVGGRRLGRLYQDWCQ